MAADAKETILTGRAILGIELGSTRIKAVLIDADGRQQMIYKHAISTIAPLSPIDLHEADETGEE